MIPYEFNAERFSRWMAYVLRHNATRYGLQPDQHGYVNVEEVLRAAGSRYPKLNATWFHEFMESSGDRRFELVGGRVRARYGHSISVEPVGPPVKPPAQLYHGTEATHIDAMLSSGLQPMGRRMVHLSQTKEEALAIARRRTARPALILVKAGLAHEAGVTFYREAKVYLTAHIPASFLQMELLPGEGASALDSRDQAGDQPQEDL